MPSMHEHDQAHDYNLLDNLLDGCPSVILKASQIGIICDSPRVAKPFEAAYVLCNALQKCWKTAAKLGLAQLQAISMASTCGVAM